MSLTATVAISTSTPSRPATVVDADERAERQADIERREHAGSGAVEERRTVLPGRPSAVTAMTSSPTASSDGRSSQGVGTTMHAASVATSEASHGSAAPDRLGQPRELDEGQRGDRHGNDEQRVPGQEPDQRDRRRGERQAAQDPGHVTGLVLDARGHRPEAMPP